MSLTKVSDTVNKHPNVRNLIINGGFNIWQRGTSWPGGMSSSPLYTADRFTAERSGSGVNSLEATSTSAPNHRTSLKFSSLDTSAKNLYVWQRIEGDNFKSLVGETVFVGAWVRINAASDAYIQVMSNPGSRDTWSSNENTDKTLVKNTGFSISAATWTFISTTFIVTDECKNGVAIGIRLGELAVVTSCYVTGIRVYKGDTKISWSLLNRPYGEELALCQRFYEIGEQALFTGDVTNGGLYRALQNFVVTKRVNPALTFADQANAHFPAGIPTGELYRTNMFRCYKTANATGTAGYYIYSWTADAEL